MVRIPAPRGHACGGGCRSWRRAERDVQVARRGRAKETGMSRRTMVLLLATSVVLAASLAYSQQLIPKAAQTSVHAWLVLIDQENYAPSWETAASAFKNATTQDKWQAAVRSARVPLGALKSRTLKSATAATSLPGAPDGEYVVFQFNTAFDQKAAAVETVTA